MGNKLTSVDINDLMTTKEVAAVLRRHPHSLANDRANGRNLPFIKYGRKVYYRKSDVEALLAKFYHGEPVAN